MSRGANLKKNATRIPHFIEITPLPLSLSWCREIHNVFVRDHPRYGRNRDQINVAAFTGCRLDTILSIVLSFALPKKCKKILETTCTVWRWRKRLVSQGRVDRTVFVDKLDIESILCTYASIFMKSFC